MLLVSLLLGAFAASACAQESETTPQSGDQKEEVVNLDTVRVTAPKLETLDLYRFRNPVEVEGTALDKYYRETPTVEDISLQGGYLLLGIHYGLMKAAEQVTKLPGWKGPIQHATARPSPLTEAQMQRAKRASEESGDDPRQGGP